MNPLEVLRQTLQAAILAEGGHDFSKIRRSVWTSWLTAVWLIVNCNNGISSYEIARDFGVTQKSAWFMAHRIRLALQAGNFGKFGGEVEVDETFIGLVRRTERERKRQRRGKLKGG